MGGWACVCVCVEGVWAGMCVCECVCGGCGCECVDHAWLYYLMSEGCNTTVGTRSHMILSSPGGRSLSNLCPRSNVN